MSDNTVVNNVSGPGTGLRGYASMVADTVGHMGKAPAFTAIAALALLVLAYAAYANKEPIALSVGVVASAFFGGGALKNFADQKFTNGNGGNGAPK